MPRVTRDSDEDVEAKSSVRITRASSAAIAADSPIRRGTRSSRQLATIESSPESLDESNVQRIGRATRSRTATLDKTMANVAKNLRSRKNSASSDQSESVLTEGETTKKKVVKKSALASVAPDTPTKNLRSRHIRAGSESTSTPPRTKRVTRATSVDPVVAAPEKSAIPTKRRTRASMVPMSSVMEELGAKNKAYRSLENTVMEIDETDENLTISYKKDNSKISQEDIKDTEIVKELDNDSDKSTQHSPKKYEECVTQKSCTSEINEESTINFITTDSISTILESSTVKIKSSENSKCSEESVIVCSSLNDDEKEFIDVVGLHDNSVNDFVIVVDSPKKSETEINKNQLKMELKDSYVKLNRTTIVEKLLTEKVDENKSNNQVVGIQLNDNNNSLITNEKTVVVLTDNIPSTNLKIDNNISLGLKFNINSTKSKDKVNGSTDNSDDENNSIISIGDEREIMTPVNEISKSKLIFIDKCNHNIKSSAVHDSSDNVSISTVTNLDTDETENTIKNDEVGILAPKNLLNDLPCLINNINKPNESIPVMKCNVEIVKLDSVNTKNDKLSNIMSINIESINSINETAMNVSDSEMELMVDDSQSDKSENNLFEKENLNSLNKEVADTNIANNCFNKSNFVNITNDKLNKLISTNYENNYCNKQISINAQLMNVSNIEDDNLSSADETKGQCDKSNAINKCDKSETSLVINQESEEPINKIVLNTDVNDIHNNGIEINNIYQDKSFTKQISFTENINHSNNNENKMFSTKETKDQNVESNSEKMHDNLSDISVSIYKEKNQCTKQISIIENFDQINSLCINNELMSSDFTNKINKPICINENRACTSDKADENSIFLHGDSSESDKSIIVKNSNKNDDDFIQITNSIELVDSISEVKDNPINKVFSVNQNHDIEKMDKSSDEIKHSIFNKNHENKIIIESGNLELNNKNDDSVSSIISLNNDQENLIIIEKTNTPEEDVELALLDKTSEDKMTRESVKPENNSNLECLSKSVNCELKKSIVICSKNPQENVLSVNISVINDNNNFTRDVSEVREDSSNDIVMKDQKEKDFEPVVIVIDKNKSSTNLENFCNDDDNVKFHIPDDTALDFNQSDCIIPEVDKNSMSCRFADADGASASLVQSNDDNEKPKGSAIKVKNKRNLQNKSEANSINDDGDSEGLNESLFQDIPADEWDGNKSRNDSVNYETVPEKNKLSAIYEESENVEKRHNSSNDLDSPAKRTRSSLMKQNLESVQSANKEDNKKLNKSINTSLNKSDSNKSATDKLSTSADENKLIKKLNLSNEKQQSHNVSLIQEEKVGSSFDEAMEVDEYSVEENEANKVINKSINKNQSTSNNSTNTCTNNLETTKRRSANKSLNVSSRKSLVNEVSSGSDEEIIDKMENIKDKNISINKSLNKSSNLMEEKGNSSVVSTKSIIQNLVDPDTSMDEETNINEKSLNKSSKSSTLPSTNDKKEDRSLKESSFKKSLNKSILLNTILVEDSSETEKDEKANKSVNISPKKINETNVENADVSDDSDAKSEVAVNTNKSNLNSCLQKNIKMMKSSNPPKHDFSTIAQIDSSSEDEKRRNSNETMSSSNQEDDDKSIDSDIAREYNLGGKSISKYEDDDIPGDDCRASEQESSDPEDDGGDLDGFIVSDEAVENVSDEDESDENEDEDAKEMNSSSVVQLDNSANQVKNRSNDYPVSLGSESDDEATGTEVEDKQCKRSTNSKLSKSANKSLVLKEKSISNTSTLSTKNVTEESLSSESEDDTVNSVIETASLEAKCANNLRLLINNNKAVHDKILKNTVFNVSSSDEEESSDNEDEKIILRNSKLLKCLNTNTKSNKHNMLVLELLNSESAEDDESDDEPRANNFKLQDKSANTSKLSTSINKSIKEKSLNTSSKSNKGTTSGLQPLKPDSDEDDESDDEPRANKSKLQDKSANTSKLSTSINKSIKEKSLNTSSKSNKGTTSGLQPLKPDSDEDDESDDEPRANNFKLQDKSANTSKLSTSINKSIKEKSLNTGSKSNKGTTSGLQPLKPDSDEDDESDDEPRANKSKLQDKSANTSKLSTSMNKLIKEKSLNTSSKSNKGTTLGLQPLKPDSDEDDESDDEPRANKSKLQDKSANTSKLSTSMNKSIKEKSLNTSSKSMRSNLDEKDAVANKSESFNDKIVSTIISKLVKDNSLNMSKSSKQTSKLNDSSSDEDEDPAVNKSKLKEKSTNDSTTSKSINKSIKEKSREYPTKTPKDFYDFSDSEKSTIEKELCNEENTANLHSSQLSNSVNVSKKNSEKNGSKGTNFYNQNYKEISRSESEGSCEDEDKKISMSGAKNKLNKSTDANVSKNINKSNRSKSLGNSTSISAFPDKKEPKPSTSNHIASPSSESEDGEDSYRVITTKPITSKKSLVGIGCSTPKPGTKGKSMETFVDSNISCKSITSKRRSGSMNDLTESKSILHNVSTTENVPNKALQNLPAWKLIPLNKSLQIGETPVTKFLKKVKLNETVPPIQISDECKVSKKSKKRKLHETSAVNSVDDSLLVGKKHKKRPRVEDSGIMEDEDTKENRTDENDQSDLVNSRKNKENAEEMEDQTSKKKKKKKNKNISGEEAEQTSDMLKEQPKKSKNKNKSQEFEVTDQVEQVNADIKNRSQDFETNEQVNQEKLRKKKKKRLDVSEVKEEVVEETAGKKKKKRLNVESNKEVVKKTEDKKKKKKKLENVEMSEDVGLETLEVLPQSKKSKKCLARIENQPEPKKNLKSNLTNESDKHSKKKRKKSVASDDDEKPETVGFEEARLNALAAIQHAVELAKSKKQAAKRKNIEQNEIETLNRLPSDLLENLTDEPVRRPQKRRKLSNTEEILPSTSMFSPGKGKSLNLRVDDDCSSISSVGGTTHFEVINLQKTKKITKKSMAALIFREKMLARNPRLKMSAYLTYLKKIQAKNNV